MFGSVRKQADADRLKSEFGANFVPLIFDVTDEPAVLAAGAVRAALNGEKLFGLVNNAGISVAGPVLGLSADKFRLQMEVNVIGPVIATQAFGPLLGADPSLKGPPGRIVMISSVAGKSGSAVHLGLCRLEACDRGAVGKPAPRADAVRHRCHHRRARAGEDADLEQGARRPPTSPAIRTRPICRPCRRSTAFIEQLESIGLPAERSPSVVHDALTLPNPKVRYHIAPDTMRHVLTAVLPKRMMDRHRSPSASA